MRLKESGPKEGSWEKIRRRIRTTYSWEGVRNGRFWEDILVDIDDDAEFDDCLLLPDNVDDDAEFALALIIIVDEK